MEVSLREIYIGLQPELIQIYSHYVVISRDLQGELMIARMPVNAWIAFWVILNSASPDL